MSNDVVIRAEGLGKKYIIGHQDKREKYITLRDMVGRTAKGLTRSALDMLKGKPIIAGDTLEEFWALREVVFEIRRGEVVGIIGRNGAGKSTLLKVLSRITDPSEGRVEIKGRVASLLEVGTGFHPELTGRENVFLNGAILGMTREEIRQKFDEIVSFAEVEKFLDTPVKRYSSGMYVRLAFAVAAHLEPEIFIVDEVLAVGDAEFQKKCLGKMQDVAGNGRTVIFVSHNRAAVARLCPTAIWMDQGKIRQQGDATELLAAYSNFERKDSVGVTNREAKSSAYFRAVEICAVGRKPGLILNTEAVKISFEIETKQLIRDLRLSVGICNAGGEVIFSTSPRDGGIFFPKTKGIFRTVVQLPSNIFLANTYFARATLWAPLFGTYDRLEDLLIDVIADKHATIPIDNRKGQITLACDWHLIETVEVAN